MTATTLERFTETDEGFTLSRIKEGDMAHAMITLSRQYSRPKDAVIRELATNALESHQAVGYTGSVEITLPGHRDPFLTVTDHGLGLGLEDITEVVGDFAGSTKRHADQATPNYGIGSKSPYAVTDSYTVIAVKDGVRREVLFARLSDGNPGYKIISTQNTDQPNGVTVRVPVLESGSFDQWREAAKNVLYWWQEDTFRLSGENIVTGDVGAIEIPNYRDEIVDSISTENVLAMNRSVRGHKVIIRAGTTGYNVPDGFFDDLSIKIIRMGDLTLEMPKDSVKVSPNRETIEDTDDNRELIYTVLQEWSETITRAYLTKLEAATSSYNLYRAWSEATYIEKVLTYTTGFYWVCKQYGKKNAVRLNFTGYAPGANRRPGVCLSVEYVAEMVKSPCLVLDELDSRAAGIIARWRSAHGKPGIYVLSSKEDVRPLIDPDEIEWVTLDDLKAETPTKKPAEPVLALADTDTVDRIRYIRSDNQRADKSAVSVGDLREILTDGLPLVIGAIKDYEGLPIDFTKIVAIACPTRKPKVIEDALGQKAQTPAAYMRSKYLQEVATLSDEQKQAYVERATLSANVLRRADDLRVINDPDANGQRVNRYDETVLEAIKPLSNLGFALDPVYAELPGMPQPRLGIEFKHTVALLEELYSPSELLLKMALRADKMAAGDRRRRSKSKTTGTK